MKRKLSVLLAIVMVLSMLAGCSGSSNGGTSNGNDGKDSAGNDGKEKVLVVAATGEPLHFNVNATNAGSNMAAINIYSALFKTTAGKNSGKTFVRRYRLAGKSGKPESGWNRTIQICGI